MGAKEYDFGGWATRNDIVCSDGRVIRDNAFADQDGKTVPLVWNHQHGESKNVLGHALLRCIPGQGVYAYCSFNDTEAGQNSKKLVNHGDIESLSIYANELKQKGANVMHGIIREVSLVLAGANPGALIDSVPSMAHGDDGYDYADGAIYTGLDIDIGNEMYQASDSDDTEDTSLQHADEDPKKEEKPMADEAKKTETSEDSGKTVKDVYDSMTEEQQKVCAFLVGQAVEDAKGGKEDDDSEGDEDMKHNVFEQDTQDTALMHDALQADVIKDAKRCGSMKESFLEHAAEYGVDHIEWLKPEYQNIDGNGAPQFIKRQPDGWVGTVTGGVHHTPFARIKMVFADLREDEARAKGYMKGKLKKEEVFGLLKRTVDPTTIYKKQKFDRDDVIDITDFDVISWIKGEMRMMLDEEIARAILFGDGRSAVSEDHINPQNIIPIYDDADLYTIKKEVTPATGESLAHALINASVKAQDEYEGSGNLTCFLAASMVSDMLLLEDTLEHRMYKDMNELALAMGVDKIVKVPASIIPSGVYALIVDLKDYNVGADKGGQINMFDDFDIDYNQMKYLIETRISGALTKPFSAIVLKAGE